MTEGDISILSVDSDNWDTDFTGELDIPVSYSQVHTRLNEHLERVKTFSASSKQLEQLLLSIPDAHVTREIFDNGIITQCLHIVALSHDDTDAAFFRSKIGAEYLRFTNGRPDELVEVNEDVLTELSQQSERLVPELTTRVALLT